MRLNMWFNPGHPWAYRKFSLRAWADGRTDLCKHFDFVFWVCAACGLVLLLRMFR
jgi:hypothetical protein